MEVARVHFENVIGVRRTAAVNGKRDGGNEGAIVGVFESLERVFWGSSAG